MSSLLPGFLLTLFFTVACTSGQVKHKSDSLLSEAQRIYENDLESRGAFHDIDNRTYYINDDLSMPWLQVAQFCNSINMTMLNLETQHENRMVRSYLNFQKYNLAYWTSGVRILDKWIWSGSGHYFTFTDWYVGYPSQPNNDDVCDLCLHLLYDEGWFDGSCSANMRTICEQMP